VTGSAGTPEARPGREPESASFDVSRVGRARRGWQPAVILGFLVVLAAVVTVGVGGRSPAPTPALPPVAAASPAPTRVPSESPIVPAPTTGPRIPLASPPTVMSEGGPIRLQATRFRASTFVHGDVFVPRVTWVFVSLQDDLGRVAGWASVSVPGAAGPARDAGPNLRFDVELAVPDSFSGLRMWLNANAYDTDGALMASVHLEVPGIGA
jgi:hypothetical protein